MNKTTVRVIIAIIAILLLIPSLGFAQEKEKDKMPYWEITQYQVDRAKIDSLKILEEKYYSKIVEQAKKMGLIEDSKFLIMQIGGDEYNVIEINKCSSWDKLNFEWEDAFKIVEPNKGKRDEVYAAYRWVFEGKARKSAIYSAAAKFYH